MLAYYHSIADLIKETFPGVETRLLGKSMLDYHAAEERHIRLEIKMMDVHFTIIIEEALMRVLHTIYKPSILNGQEVALHTSTFGRYDLMDPQSIPKFLKEIADFMKIRECYDQIAKVYYEK